MYLQRMTSPGTWCDNIIIQAVANQLHCVIHIIESRLSYPEGSTITPSGDREITKVLFFGYIEDLHYVSTVPHGRNTNALIPHSHQHVLLNWFSLNENYKQRTEKLDFPLDSSTC